MWHMAYISLNNLFLFGFIDNTFLFQMNIEVTQYYSWLTYKVVVVDYFPQETFEDIYFFRKLGQ